MLCSLTCLFVSATHEKIEIKVWINFDGNLNSKQNMDVLGQRPWTGLSRFPCGAGHEYFEEVAATAPTGWTTWRFPIFWSARRGLSRAAVVRTCLLTTSAAAPLVVARVTSASPQAPAVLLVLYRLDMEGNGNTLVMARDSTNSMRVKVTRRWGREVFIELNAMWICSGVTNHKGVIFRLVEMDLSVISEGWQYALKKMTQWYFLNAPLHIRHPNLRLIII